MPKSLTSALGIEYAQQLRASSLGEIATWCEMASRGLGRSKAEADDAEVYEAAAKYLRLLQQHGA